jgi:hypothetical protein
VTPAPLAARNAHIPAIAKKQALDITYKRHVMDPTLVIALLAAPPA